MLVLFFQRGKTTFKKLSRIGFKQYREFTKQKYEVYGSVVSNPDGDKIVKFDKAADPCGTRGWLESQVRNETTRTRSRTAHQTQPVCFLLFQSFRTASHILLLEKEEMVVRSLGRAMWKRNTKTRVDNLETVQ